MSHLSHLIPQGHLRPPSSAALRAMWIVVPAFAFLRAPVNGAQACLSAKRALWILAASQVSLNLRVIGAKSHTHTSSCTAF
mmetsp:Transcript_28146/g.50808  ORF Transcript_28146/g.50808 Transcript_28146/m.50808 type:complete len:81 (-) Transcript_28146:119-361(-)